MREHKAAEAGIEITASGGYRKHYPLWQWRQAFRNALSRYWATEKHGFLGVHVRSEDLKLQIQMEFLPWARHSEVTAWFEFDSALKLQHAPHVLQVETLKGDDLACGLSRLSCCRSVRGLVVPVRAAHDSFPIRDNMVTLWAGGEDNLLMLTGGSPFF